VVADATGRSVDDLDHIRLAAEHTELAGRHGEAQLYRQYAMVGRMFDDSPAEQGLDEGRRQLEFAENRSERALAATCVSCFATLTGARDDAASALELAERLAAGLHEDVAKIITWLTSLAQTYTGQWTGAAVLLAEVCANDEEAGALGTLSTYAALHAHALLHLGRPDLAGERLELSQRIAADDDIITHGLISGVQAWLAALDGDHGAWEQHVARATTALSDEDLSMRALIHEGCAESAVVLGERTVADQHRQHALDLHRAKGNVVSVARLEAML
jgi:hypothetical protein